jgi:hypothetical protein
MATQPPCDEGGKLVVYETVIDLEHAQFDRWETLARQVAGHTSHILDGPDAIPAPRREPGSRAETTPAPWHNVTVQHREGSEETLTGSDVGCVRSRQRRTRQRERVQDRYVRREPAAPRARSPSRGDSPRSRRQGAARPTRRPRR